MERCRNLALIRIREMSKKWKARKTFGEDESALSGSFTSFTQARKLYTYLVLSVVHQIHIDNHSSMYCIIGTKIATKVLKDGDMVEVDASEGIVRILK